jgi:hypothetical protein
VAVKSIQLGQIWRSNEDGQDYLVTKVYSEVFSQYAILRLAGTNAPDAPAIRVKVVKRTAPRFPGTPLRRKGPSRWPERSRKAQPVSPDSLLR